MEHGLISLYTPNALNLVIFVHIPRNSEISIINRSVCIALTTRIPNGTAGWKSLPTLPSHTEISNYIQKERYKENSSAWSWFTKLYLVNSSLKAHDLILYKLQVRAQWVQRKKNLSSTSQFFGSNKRMLLFYKRAKEMVQNTDQCEMLKFFGRCSRFLAFRALKMLEIISLHTSHVLS